MPIHQLLWTEETCEMLVREMMGEGELQEVRVKEFLHRK